MINLDSDTWGHLMLWHGDQYSPSYSLAGSGKGTLETIQQAKKELEAIKIDHVAEGEQHGLLRLISDLDKLIKESNEKKKLTKTFLDGLHSKYYTEEDILYKYLIHNLSNKLSESDLKDLLSFAGIMLLPKILYGLPPKDCPDLREKANRARKDYHTEHCCQKCGCKYGNDCCSVVTGYRKQSFPCGGNAVCGAL